MVYKAIWEELQSTVHAVDQMTTKTPDEAAANKWFNIMPVVTVKLSFEDQAVALTKVLFFLVLLMCTPNEWSIIGHVLSVPSKGNIWNLFCIFFWICSSGLKKIWCYLRLFVSPKSNSERIVIPLVSFYLFCIIGKVSKNVWKPTGFLKSWYSYFKQVPVRFFFLRPNARTAHRRTQDSIDAAVRGQSHTAARARAHVVPLRQLRACGRPALRCTHQSLFLGI